DDIHRFRRALGAPGRTDHPVPGAVAGRGRGAGVRGGRHAVRTLGADDAEPGGRHEPARQRHPRHSHAQRHPPVPAAEGPGRGRGRGPQDGSGVRFRRRRAVPAVRHRAAGAGGDAGQLGGPVRGGDRQLQGNDARGAGTGARPGGQSPGRFQRPHPRELARGDASAAPDRLRRERLAGPQAAAPGSPEPGGQLHRLRHPHACRGHHLRICVAQRGGRRERGAGVQAGPVRGGVAPGWARGQGRPGARTDRYGGQGVHRGLVRAASRRDHGVRASPLPLGAGAGARPRPQAQADPGAAEQSVHHPVPGLSGGVGVRHRRQDPRRRHPGEGEAASPGTRGPSEQTPEGLGAELDRHGAEGAGDEEGQAGRHSRLQQGAAQDSAGGDRGIGNVPDCRGRPARRALGHPVLQGEGRPGQAAEGDRGGPGPCAGTGRQILFGEGKEARRDGAAESAGGDPRPADEDNGAGTCQGVRGGPAPAPGRLFRQCPDGPPRIHRKPDARRVPVTGVHASHGPRAHYEDTLRQVRRERDPLAAGEQDARRVHADGGFAHGRQLPGGPRQGGAQGTGVAVAASARPCLV
ncbi:MAG: hypothetical protein AVDCRST_MAG89-1586, partial [uncultured Gemmatimonadetes bacterium]